MLKWLVKSGEGEREVTNITDDPLATLEFKKHKHGHEIYSVNRINPLYEDGDNFSPSSGSGSDIPETPPSRTASSSSGYGSNNQTQNRVNNPASVLPISRASVESETDSRGSKSALHVSKTLLNSGTELESCQPQGDEMAITSLQGPPVTQSVPPPVWPPHTLRINFDSKHVASQVHKLSVLADQRNKIKRNNSFVSSVIVGQSSRDIEQSSRGLGLSARPISGGLELGLANRDFGLTGKDTLRRNKDGGPLMRSLGQSSVRGTGINKIERSPARSSVPVTKTEHIQRNGVGRSGPVRRNNKLQNLNIKHNTDYVNSIELGKRGMGRMQQGGGNQCFRIRYGGMSPIGEEVRKVEDTGEENMRRYDSIVTDSLLQMVSFSPTDGSSGDEVDVGREGKVEDMDKVIQELTQAVIKSRGANRNTRLEPGRRSVRMKSGRKKAGSGRRRERKAYDGTGSRTGTLPSKGGVDSMKDLWNKTGMKTNGRKLVMESEDEEETRRNANGRKEKKRVETRHGVRKGHVNLAYESDGSQDSRVRGSQTSSTTTYESVSHPRLVRSSSVESSGRSWELEGGVVRVNGLDTVDLDNIHLEDDRSSEGSNKHVRFSNRTRDNETNNRLLYDKVGVGGTTWAGRLVARVGEGDMDRTTTGNGHQRLWETYYGSTQVDGKFVKQKGFGGKDPGENMWRTNDSGRKLSGYGSDLTLDQMTSYLLTKKAKSRKRLKCYCTTFCFLLLIVSFILVIVSVSIFLTNGKATFGPI